jgi:hypothetical protein
MHVALFAAVAPQGAHLALRDGGNALLGCSSQEESSPTLLGRLLLLFLFLLLITLSCLALQVSKSRAV